MKHRLVYTLLCGISVLATAQTSTHASAALPMAAGAPQVTSETTHTIFAGAEPLQLGRSLFSTVSLSSLQIPMDVPVDAEPVVANSIQHVLAFLPVDKNGVNGRYPIGDMTIKSTQEILNILLRGGGTPAQLNREQLRNFFVSYAAVLRLERDREGGTALRGDEQNYVKVLTENYNVRLTETDTDKQFVGQSNSAISFSEIKAAYNIIDHYIKLAQGVLFPSNAAELDFAKRTLQQRLQAKNQWLNTVKYVAPATNSNVNGQYTLLVRNDKTGLYELPEQTPEEIGSFSNHLYALDVQSAPALPTQAIQLSDNRIVPTTVDKGVDAAIQFDLTIRRSLGQPPKYVFVRTANLASLKNATANSSLLDSGSTSNYCGIDTENGRYAPFVKLKDLKIYVSPQVIAALNIMTDKKDPKRPGCKVTPQEKGLAMALTQGAGTTEAALLAKLTETFSEERAKALLKFIIDLEEIEEESDEG
jgi:hypothetical protein